MALNKQILTFGTQGAGAFELKTRREPVLACWESCCFPVLWVMLSGEKQQGGPFGQGMMFPESGDSKIPREQEEECVCVCVYVSPCLWKERGCSSVVLDVHKAT